jgi:hypothetical protein
LQPQLHKSTVGEPKTHDYDDGEDDNLACPLTTPAFHFCFALIRAALSSALTTPAKGKSPAADDSGDEKVPI